MRSGNERFGFLTEAEVTGFIILMLKALVQLAQERDLQTLLPGLTGALRESRRLKIAQAGIQVGEGRDG